MNRPGQVVAAARLLGGATGADDVVQDVYLQAWKSFGQFEKGTNCRAWLFKILFHTLHHYRRKWLNARMVKDPDEALDQAAGPGPTIPDHITDEEMLAALTEVPPDYRAVVLLVDVEEFSYKDAAGILGAPIGTAASDPALHAARADAGARFAQRLGAAADSSRRAVLDVADAAAARPV